MSEEKDYIGEWKGMAIPEGPEKKIQIQDYQCEQCEVLPVGARQRHAFYTNRSR